MKIENTDKIKKPILKSNINYKIFKIYSRKEIQKEKKNFAL